MLEVKPNQESAGPPEHVKNLILGSGPAGLSAALYSARAQLEPVVLAGQEYGGQVSLTHIIENYPGFPDAVGGPELTELFKKQAERFGARVVFDTAIEVDLSQRPFRVKTYEKEYLADTLIIATGATPRHLGVPGEVELTGRGVSYCGTCDGFFFKDKDVIVVGGGDSAMEEGAFLTRFANNVTLVHRREEFRAGDLLLQRAKENPKMKFITDTVVNKIEGNGAVNTVELENLKTGDKQAFKTDGVFIFIGHTPNTQLFQGQLEMDAGGYLIANKYMETSVPGVFVAGEVADPHFRQVITSAGMGAAAAIQATRFLEENP
ncbi:MAG: thioredoxin-disulfide reductase [Anaerolineales bacterium]|nr:thioredoxin-disulfide reductase [Anaerolineales bacterium]